MYTEGFEGLEEAQQGSRRAYVSSVSQEDAERLLRENERLRKSLEKEKFFNKLLDQEIQELKGNSPSTNSTGYYSEYWTGKRGISKGSFYTLLVISLAMASYIVYDLNYKKQSVPQLTDPVSSITPAATTSKSNEPANGKGQPQSAVNSNGTGKPSGQNAPAAPPPVKDSVPNIIGAKKPTPLKEKQQATVTESAPEIDDAEIEAVIGDNHAADAGDNRAVIGRYRVTSKANFYTAPDENTMRSTFIAESNNKIVGALEEKNDFIFVVYTNDLGYTSRGWLSKKDLTKVE